MGIPHLTSHLQPYAKLGPLVGDAVVDGPAFAYHVYFICLNNRPSARNALEAAPTYYEIGKTAIAWLDGLVSSGMNIKKVYFDGYLPPSKLKTRLERLRTQTRRLNEYHAANPRPCRAYIAPRDAIARNLFGDSAARAQLTMISPPAFLVPAVIDALRSSKYIQDTVTTVPGEADLYCAIHVKEHGGTVITGDSDLLVHDLGQGGAMCFFKDIQVGNVGESLRGYLYTPADIMARLNLRRGVGLRALAYELIGDQHATLPNLLARASVSAAINTDPEGYKLFCNEYAPPCVKPDAELVQQDKCVQSLQTMDPRISEYILQFPSIADMAGHAVSATDATHVFLPFLLDWPDRTNAWEMSTSVLKGILSLLKLWLFFF